MSLDDFYRDYQVALDRESRLFQLAYQALENAVGSSIARDLAYTGQVFALAHRCTEAAVEIARREALAQAEREQAQHEAEAHQQVLESFVQPLSESNPW